MNKEPVRHHYIPQFILRNFCFDERNHLFYYDKKTSETSKRKTKEIFMDRNLYRDDINHIENPTKIESDMACFESEVAQIIANKFLGENEISLTLEEDEKLKIFFAIMAFRSKNISDKFGIGASDENKEFYSMYQKNEDLSDFWKRNLGNLVNCRSLREILSHEGIDEPIKLFFIRDTIGYFGLYFIVGERRGHIDFIISDAYPTVVYGVMDGGMKLPMYSMFPISANRIVFLAANGVEGAPRNVAVLGDEILKKPKLNKNKRIIRIHVKKMYENEVRYVNSLLIKEACEGFAFKNKDRVDLSNGGSQ